MAQENIDPVYKYVDDKIKLIRRELQQLKRAHDAVAAEQKEALLATQRTVARFIMVSTARNTKDILYRHMRYVPDIDIDTITTQLVSDVSVASTKLDVSNNPLAIAIKFQDKCHNLLGKFKISMIDIP